MTWDRVLGIIVGLAFITYHYIVNRDIRRTLHRIAADMARLREAAESDYPHK